MKRKRGSVGRLGALLRTGLVAAVLVSGLAFPVVAAVGLGTKAGLEMIDELPRELAAPPSAQTSYVYAADGTLLTMFYEEHRKSAPISQISTHVQKAIVAAEDARFYEHKGVDFKGVARAFVANQQAGGVSQGASTLTMQYVRMALRDSAETPAEAMAATEQTVQRKAREMKLALELEKRMSKEQILEAYLNSAYFGHRAYGIAAASEVFFSKLPKYLTIGESATLAGLVKAPSAFDPASRNVKPATERRNYVVDKMLALGYIGVPDATKAKAKAIKLKLTTPRNDCVSVPRELNSWGFFCDMFKSWWARQPAFGASPNERLDRLRRGGYRIVTSIVPRTQKIALKHVLTKESLRSRYAHGTVTIEPGTGRVRAMAVNRVYSLNKSRNGRHSAGGKRKGNYPNTVNALLGGGDLPGYQAGSTFKIFTLLAALDLGLPLTTSFYAPQTYRSKYPAYSGRCGGRWCVRNASASMTGRKNMWSGFGQSVNTYFVQLEQRIGAQRVVRMAERLGLRWRTPIDRLLATPARAPGWGSFTLGVADTSPLEMANAFATVAADGRYCEALPVVSIKDPAGQHATYVGADGKLAVVASPRCRQALRPQVARAATDAARCVTGYGAANRGRCGSWSTASDVYSTMGRPVAGKSGTTDDYRSAWFVGYTPQMAVASFIADPDNPRHVVGSGNGSKPRTTVAQTMREVLKGSPARKFTTPRAARLR